MTCYFYHHLKVCIMSAGYKAKWHRRPRNVELPADPRVHEAIESYYKEKGGWEDPCWIGGSVFGISFPSAWVGPWYYDIHSDPGYDVFQIGMV